MLHKHVVSKGLLDALRKLMEVDELSAFRLVGGSALALQLGHRESVDIDLFSFREFPKKILNDTVKNIFRNITWNQVKQKVFDAFDTFRNDEINEKIEEMKKRPSH